MVAPKYPQASSLIFTFLQNVRRQRINSIRGLNPTLINVDGEQMYLYIKNLSPAQLSNENPDIWRIQLPKRQEFEAIKKSESLFILLGYDYVNKVYTSWNPYWCKQRLNVAESCSLYSRLSLQKRVAQTQKIEKLSLQNDGDVVCIPASLIGIYIKDIRKYYPQESIYIPVGSSIQKRENEEKKVKVEQVHNTKAQQLFDDFVKCYNTDEFRTFLDMRGYTHETILIYISKLIYAFENQFIQAYQKEFLECSELRDYVHVINRLCWNNAFKSFSESWRQAMQASLKQYLLFVEQKVYGTNSIRVRLTGQQKSIGTEESPIKPAPAIARTKETKPSASPVKGNISYELDEFGRLKELDQSVINYLLPEVKGIDYPDWEEIIKKIEGLYPPKAIEKMTPVEWMDLIDKTQWKHREPKRRRTKTATKQQRISSKPASSPRVWPYIRITTHDGNIIQKSNATETFVYAVETNFPDLIIDIKFNVGDYVISRHRMPDYTTTKRTQRELPGGFFLSTNFDTATKVKILQQISDELGLDWTVELINV